LPPVSAFQTRSAWQQKLIASLEEPGLLEQEETALIPTLPSQRVEDKRVYESVKVKLVEMYRGFDPRTETGIDQQKGLTGNLQFISSKDLTSILRHIANDNGLLQQAMKKSAITIMFDKIYLMSGEEGEKWNLRLHFYPVDGRFGNDAPEQPHFHRWTLASKMLWGGYLNTNYDVKPADGKDDENTLHEYRLQSSSAHRDKTMRPTEYVGPVQVVPVEKQIYGKDDIRHFPIETAHSVTTYPHFMGTTLTLALSGQEVKDLSRTFQKTPELKTLPAYRYENPADFKQALFHRVALLQLVEVGNAFIEHLEGKESLTEGEQKHLADGKEFNYMETSFLPALAVFALTGDEGNTEFSPETKAFLHRKLQEIDPELLKYFTVDNQSNLGKGKLSIFPETEELAEALEGRNTEGRPLSDEGLR
jgi:hypothetical protein